MSRIFLKIRRGKRRDNGGKSPSGTTIAAGGWAIVKLGDAAMPQEILPT
jgi:hypothetical protein